jgi:hypothetical protein
MIAPQELPSPGLPDIESHGSNGRAGPYKVSDLQTLLDPFLNEGQASDHTKRKWPFGYTLIGALIICAVLWGAIIWAVIAVFQN